MGLADWFSTFSGNIQVQKGATISTRYKAITKRLSTDFWNTTSESLHEGGKTINFTQENGLGSRENRRGGPLPGDVKDGSPSLDRVFSIGEDATGNIWFGLQGTEGYGAWRYDGKTLRHFTEKDGLTSKHISVIYRDKRGDLWLGGNGVFKFNGESFDRIH